MKRTLLAALFVVTAAPLSLSKDANLRLTALQSEKDDAASGRVESYQDVLARIPAELRATKPRAWTRIQREEVNDALKASLVDKEAKLRLTVVDIADWGGWTCYANIPNREGYPIRVFGKFDDDWKERFSTLKKGDTVVLKGVMSGATYRELWNKFTLSIGLKNCTFIKVEAPAQPNSAL